jgi:hypothetical protein
MSKFERLLVAGSTELPDCRCAAEMRLMAIVHVPEGDTEIRIFQCPACSHELRLTAWRTDALATEPSRCESTPKEQVSVGQLGPASQ